MQVQIGYTGDHSWIHRLDPRTKLVWAGAVLVAAFLLESSVLLLGLLAIAAVLCQVSRIKMRQLVLVFQVLAIIALQLVLVQGLFNTRGDIFWQLGMLKLYTGGLSLGLLMALRLAMLVLVFMQLITWTHPTDFALLLVKLKVPYRYALLVGMGFRFLPLLEEELQTIYQCQQVRGLELNSVCQKIKGLLPVTLPLLLRAFQRATQVALSMELKGYGYSPTRTFCRELRYTRLDLAVTLVLVAAVLALLTWKILL